MYRVIQDGGVEQYEKPMPKHYWRRHKVPSVNYIRDTPFATDKQLEDQRLLIEKNKNPRFYEPTKVDKVRSEKIIAPIGISRDVAVKAKVLNKIVREASGIHNYTIVPPPKTDKLKKKDEIFEPETNPKVRSYAKEAKMKPVICSFGHRPSSASRTFHPATMKFRLKHGEIASASNDPTKTGFGLPVTILKQVLYAPRIMNNSTIANESTIESPTSNKDISEYQNYSNDNYKDLFFNAEEEKTMFGNTKPLETKGSWISSFADDSISMKKSNSKNKLSSITQQLNENRPKWDEAHHRIKVPSNTVFELRKSALNDGKLMPLPERLTRFSKLNFSETQELFVCKEKQETDKKIMSGLEHHVPKSTSIPGKPLYYDPNQARIIELEYLRKLKDNELKLKYNAKEYQNKLNTIPKINYYPTSKLVEINKKKKLIASMNIEKEDNFNSNHDLLEDSLITKNSSPTINMNIKHSNSINNYNLSILNDENDWENLEYHMKSAMRAAKSGDTNALYQLNIKSKLQNKQLKKELEELYQEELQQEQYQNEDNILISNYDNILISNDDNIMISNEDNILISNEDNILTSNEELNHI